MHGCSCSTFTPCTIKNYLVYFENELSYSECIVRGAQKGWLPREFAGGPRINKCIHNSSIKTLPECRILPFLDPQISNFFWLGEYASGSSQRTNHYKIKTRSLQAEIFFPAPKCLWATLLIVVNQLKM